jgi:ACT domain-containing protein
MPRFVTHAEVSAIPDGGVVYLEDDAELTPLAAERARARGLEVRSGRAPAAEGLVEAVTAGVLARLGPVASGDAERVVRAVAAALREAEPPSPPSGLPPSADYCASYLDAQRRRVQRKAVITTTGRNQKGVVARLTTAIANLDGDILDIAQTLVGDYFTMLLVVDTEHLSVSFADFQAAVHGVMRELGAQSLVMHEDIVTSMHRV